MKSVIQKIVKPLCFVLIVLVLISVVSRLLMPTFLSDRWESSTAEHGFYNVEDNSLDVLFLGSSMMSCSVSPLELYADYGISSYNLSIQSQSILGMYTWAKEALQTQKPAVAVLEVRMLCKEASKRESLERISYEYMKMGPAKLEYAFEYCRTHDDADLWSYLFPLALYHDRWSDLNDNDYKYVFSMPSSADRGETIISTLKKAESKFLTGQSDAVYPTDDEVREYYQLMSGYFQKMLDYFKEHNVDVILYKALDPTWEEEMHNCVQEIAEENNVTFLDFNMEELGTAVDLDYQADMADKKHVNIWGNEKITQYLGQYLTSNYELTDYRQVNGKAHDLLEEQYAGYKRLRENEKLKGAPDLSAFLKRLAEGEGYTLIAANRGITDFAYKDDHIESLKKLGLEKTASLQPGENADLLYVEIANTKSGNYQMEESETETIDVSKELADGTAVSVSGDVNKLSVMVGESEYCIDKGSLNLIVYDDVSGQVIDEFSVIRSQKGNARIKR